MEFNLKKILLALLFSTSESLSAKDVQGVITRYHQQQADADEGESAPAAAGAAESQAVMRDLINQVPSLLTTDQIRQSMEEIAHELIEQRGPVRLVEGPNGYRLTVSPEYADWIRLLRDEPRPQRLSASALETLAVIAYRQPVTRAEIEAVRGVNSDNALSRLLEKDLILVTGRAELPGRPIQYGTTDRFLEFCGLRSLEELPASDVLSPNQLNEWIRRATLPEPAIGDAQVGLPAEPEAAEGTAEPASDAPAPFSAPAWPESPPRVVPPSA